MDNPAFTDINDVGKPVGKTESTLPITDGNSTPPARGNCATRLRKYMVSGLERFFYRLGIEVAKKPVPTIVASIIIPALLCLGNINFKIDQDFTNLLLPRSSRIYGDRAWVEENVPYEQRPIRIILKNKNVLTKQSLLGLYDFHIRITNLHPEGGQNFESLCVRIGSRCFVDSLLALWKNDKETIETLTDQDVVDAINTVTTNPTYFFAFNASRMLGAMVRNSSGHIVGAEVMHADWFIQSSIEIRPIAKKLEYDAIDLALEGHPTFDKIDVFTLDSFTEEFFNGVYGDIILIVYGFPVVLFYIIMALGKPSLLENGVHLTIAALVGVALSIGACFGIGQTAGFLFGAPHQTLIFLLLAVGVDNAFVIMTTWYRIHKANPDLPIVERIGVTMQHAGVSITVTSFSDIVAFACGISTQMPVLQSFCVYCSLGILMLFLMQTTLFPACLVLNQSRVEKGQICCCDGENPSMVPSGWSQKEYLRTFLKKVYAPCLLSVAGKVIIILGTLGLAAGMIYGVSGLKKGFEFERSLPKNSYCRNFLESQRIYFSDEGPGVSVFCGPMDYQKNIEGLNTMVEEYTNSSVVMYGLVANWIPLFKVYSAFSGKTLNDDGVPADPDDFYRTLEKYFTTGLGLPFSKYIEMTTDDPPKVKWTYFPLQQIVSQDAWENEYIMEEIRRIADNADLDGGKCFTYSMFHIFTEVIRYVDTEITRNFILAGVAVFVVTLLLIVDVITSFFVLVCVCFTTVDIMGALFYWDFYLDVNLVVLLIISIGLSVDFSAHIGYTFMTLTGTREERAINTIVQIGPAIVHGAVTTFLVFFVLIFGRSLSSFFAVFTLVVVFGLFHGLCFLPVVLSILGPAPYYNAGPEGTETSDIHDTEQSAREDRVLCESNGHVTSNGSMDRISENHVVAENHPENRVTESSDNQKDSNTYL